MIVAGEHVARFVSERLGFGLTPPYTTMGIERDGEIIAGVIFSCFEGADIRVTAAGSRWTRAFLYAVGSYVYGQLECQRMTFITEQPKVVELGLRLGGLIEGRLRNHFGYDRDAVIVGVLANEYRYARTTP